VAVRPTLPRELPGFVVCAPGLSAVVAEELRALSLPAGTVSEAGVEIALTLDDLVRCNLWLRTASRVLVRLGERDTRHFTELEALAARLPWREVIARQATVRLRVTARKSRLYHTGAVAERVGKAIAAVLPDVRFAATATDEEDESESAAAQLVVVRLDRDRCTISVDSSGALLHRRGWRQATAKAPMRETLAAAVLSVSGWTPDVALSDPCCGSGTLVIEAALRAAGAAPGMSRSFALTDWPVWSAEASRLMRDAQEAARSAMRMERVPRLIATDRDAGAIAAARANADRAGVGACIRFEQVALSDASPLPSGTWTVSNPPYGRRVQAGGSASPASAHALRALYRAFDLRARAAQGGLALLTDDPALAAAAGLTDAPALRTSNGGLAVGVWRRLSMT
jgi:putative N6-adenine-specific DNA methylase